MLENYIKEQLKKKDILLMTHIVIGYPSLEESYETVRVMVEAGVDMMELQIPFSEPIADGPVILNANQVSLAQGITVQQCMEFAGKAAKEFPIPFLFMSYFNILHHYRVEKFTDDMKMNGLKGAIVPDLPFEEGKDFLESMRNNGLEPVFLFAPTTSDKRLEEISAYAQGFIYCVARKGITGMKTSFSGEMDQYLKRCRQATKLPLALGFGVKTKEDICQIKGKVEIAIIGTQSILVMEKEGTAGVKRFLQGLIC